MENTLKIKYSKKEKDFMIYYPRKCDGSLIQWHLLGNRLIWGGIDGKDKGWANYEEFNLVNELEKRGYDVKTLKFEIKLKENESKK